MKTAKKSSAKKNPAVSERELMSAMEKFFTKKPEYLVEALHEILEDIWAVKSIKASEKSGLAKKEDVLKILYGN